LGQPSINIEFKSTAITAIQRSQKGIIALILRDSVESGAHAITKTTEIPSDLSEENTAYIKRAFLGYQTPPKKIIFYIVGTEDALTGAYSYLETQKFDYLCLPPDATSQEATDCKTWIESERNDNNAIFKAVLPNLEADSYAIVNFCGAGMTDGTNVYATAQYCSRIAGILAGTPMKISATYAPLSELTDITRLSKEDADKAEEAGKLVLLHDGSKVKLGRAVNSFVTTTEDKGSQFKKIKIVEAMDMIQSDIRQTAEDSYIGKYSNSYDNKCLLISAISGYLEQLESDGILEKNGSSVSIDTSAVETYLKSIGTDTENITEQELKEADTGSKVFLKASITILDAIEDIELPITI
jgi:hypothetical protein